MSNDQTFYVDKTTATFGDELTVAGVMRLLAELAERLTGREPEVTVIARGAYYEVTCQPAIDRRQLADFDGWIFPAPFLRTANQNDIPESLPATEPFVVDFEAEREKTNRFFEARKAASRTQDEADRRGGTETVQQTTIEAPHEHWQLFRAINTPTSIIGYNNLIERWGNVHPNTGQALAVVFDLFSETPNDSEKARKAWRKLAKKNNWKVKSGGQATANQLFNPSQGKGINKTKADSITLGNVKNFWLLEWLKAVGMYEMGLTRTLRGSSDRKSYVLAPGRIDLRTHRHIMSDFHDAMRFSMRAVQSDILTVVRYVRAFLKYLEKAQEETNNGAAHPGWLADYSEIRPAQFIHGFHMAYYKDLGNASATMNLAFLNLPGWVRVRSREERTAYQNILAEHESIVGSLDETRGEELDLLSYYRDFIVADNLDPFFEFTNAYSHHIMREGEKPGYPPRRLTVNNLRRLIMSAEPQYSEILENQGFQNIAFAIRQSTVTAQWRKKEGDRRYDVRYGLGQELTRKSQYKDEFLSALSDFLHKYNAENAQVMENRSGPYRRSVRTDDIQEIVKLIDRYDSDLICKLLVAYGYARESRSEEETSVDEAA
ncbi:MAG: hypothetical protein ACOCXI_08820 [Chloroflexota bacterium]